MSFFCYRSFAASLFRRHRTDTSSLLDLLLSVFVPRSPSKNDAKLPETGEESKDAAMKESDAEDSKAEDSKAEVKTENDDGTVNKTEDSKPSDNDTAMQETKPETEDIKPVKTEENDVTTSESNKIPDSQEETNGKAGIEENEAKKGEEDSIMVPGNANTLLIKSLSPEISRADLEAVSSLNLHPSGLSCLHSSDAYDILIHSTADKSKALTISHLVNPM